MQKDIENAIKIMNHSGIILYPTDTVWGIGCDATSISATNRIYKLKERRETKSMLVLVSDTDMLQKYVDHIPPIAWDLIECCNKPTTIIYPDARNIAPNLISSDGSIGIRIVKDDFCKELITCFGKPIVSTSANISGEETPLTFNKISEKIIQAVDYVVNIKHDNINQFKPSTILKLNTDGEFKIIRP